MSPLGGHPIGSHDNQVDGTIRHQMRRRVVANQRVVDAGPGQLPRRQPRPLQDRAGLVHIDVEWHTRLVGDVHGRGGCAQVGYGQRTGVAVRQQAARLDQ